MGSMTMSHSARRLAALALALGALASAPLRAQTNFSFFLGATSISSDQSDETNLGACVGLTTKFNAFELVRLRSQVHVDKIQIDDRSGYGRQSATMVCLGFGGELVAGGRDIDLFVHATPHGTIRTLFRTEQQSDGSVHVSDLTRFSLGIVFGAGFEWFITDNIGFELQAQYDIYNFDHDDADPIYRGVRGIGGLQFYLGRNYAR
jgi:hypothetical protein